MEYTNGTWEPTMSFPIKSIDHVEHLDLDGGDWNCAIVVYGTPFILMPNQRVLFTPNKTLLIETFVKEEPTD